MALTCTARPRQSSPDRVTNPALCPPDLKTFWDRRDDLYQVGLPAWTLLSGDVHHGGVKKPAVNVLAKKDGVLRDGHQDGNRRQVAALRACRRHAGSARRMTPRGHHGARAACALLLRRAARTALRSACPQTAASRTSQPRGGEVLGRGRATHREGRCQHQHTYGREPQYSLLARQCGLWAAAMPLLSALPGGLGWAGVAAGVPPLLRAPNDLTAAAPSTNATTADPASTTCQARLTPSRRGRAAPGRSRRRAPAAR